VSFFRSLVFLICALSAIPAAAQRGGTRQAEQEIERLLDESRQAYDNLELDQADDVLDQAVQLGERNDVHNLTLADALCTLWNHFPGADTRARLIAVGAHYARAPDATG
jgi:hypothetical protein